MVIMINNCAALALALALDVLIELNCGLGVTTTCLCWAPEGTKTGVPSLSHGDAPATQKMPGDASG